MNLGFKPHFIEKIKAGTKIHTIREDSFGRWGKGMLLQFCTGIRTKQYKAHGKTECDGTQKIQFVWKEQADPNDLSLSIFIDGRKITDQHTLDLLALNDGFDSYAEFIKWESWDKKSFTGKIIHWTSKRY